MKILTKIRWKKLKNVRFYSFENSIKKEIWVNLKNQALKFKQKNKKRNNLVLKYGDQIENCATIHISFFVFSWRILRFGRHICFVFNSLDYFWRYWSMKKTYDGSTMAACRS